MDEDLMANVEQEEDDEKTLEEDEIDDNLKFVEPKDDWRSKPGVLRQGFASESPPQLFHLTTKEDDLEKELFPEELEAFKKLKEQHPDLCSKFTDRFLANALLQWYLDIDDTVKLLNTNWKFREKYGLLRLGDFPRSAYLNETWGPMMDCFYAIPGARSKTGQSVFYLEMSKFEYPKNLTIKDGHMMAVYMCTMMESEKADTFRNGLMFIADMKGMKWRHFNAKMEKAMGEVYQDTFPMRWYLCGMIEPPRLIKAVMAIMKLFIKKKIMDRYKIIPRKSILDLIDADQCPKEWGGNVDYSAKEYARDLDTWSQNYFYESDTPSTS